jgi:hypothetical protein
MPHFFFSVSSVVLFCGKLIHHGYGAYRALYFSLFLLVFGYFLLFNASSLDGIHPESIE